MEALIGVQTSFVRTPKYAIGVDKVRTAAPSAYRRRSGWLPYVELGIGTYFLAMVTFAIETMNLLSVPFLLLFVCGYYWAGFTTLYQEHQDRVQWQRARRLAEAA